MKYIVNLNVRSNYSFLSSTINLSSYIAFAKEHQLTTLSLTNKNIMYGSYEFYGLCKENNIKPIIGLDCDWIHIEKDIELTLISTNYEGYRALIKISTIINTKNKILTDQNVINYLINNKNIITIIKSNKLLEKEVQEVFSFLNPNNKNLVYFGVKFEDLSSLEVIKKTTNNIIPFNLVSYLNSKDATTYQVLQAIKEQTTLSTEKLVSTGYSYYKSLEDYKSLFSEELIKNINTLIENCNLELPKLTNIQKIKNLPIFQCPNNLKNIKYLKQLCKTGLEKRFNSKDIEKTYMTRLLYELEIINLMGFDDYFLIVYDYVQFAKKNNIIVGPGRGSAAGSLVSYVLEITDVDPIKYELIFERFLNPQRTSLPDIDIDFQDERREEIFQYLAKKYGVDHVAHIVTFQTIASKMALRDLGRVFNINLEEINEITKLIPLQYNFSLNQAIKQSPKLSVYAKKYEVIFNLANKIIGFPRQTSTHAAGVVLSQEPLDTLVPLQSSFNNIYQTQYPMNDLEAIGLIKMDILGLRNLTILKNILEKVKQYYSVDLKLETLPLDDKKTFTIIRDGDTTGIFQLESTGMRQILKDMETNNLEDIIATSSLFRPGPQEYIKTYIKRKLEQEKVSYIHPDLIPYLSSTYGIIVYQEQILLILQKIAGYSLATSDLIRRAIGKKDAKEMEQQTEKFIKSGVNNGYDEAIVKKIWEDIKQFAGYGFNRSHAVAYSLIGYWLAYLKANFPLAFMSCLLTSVIGNDQKLLQYLYECEKYQIKILPPSINYGQLEFAIDAKKNAISYALPAIKQMSFSSCTSLIKERRENGLFKNFFDFCARAIFIGLNKKNCEFLISAGALDEINPNRSLLLGNLDNGLRYASIVQIKDKENNSVKLNLSLAKPAMIDLENNWNNNSINEYKALGLYLKYNPEVYWKKNLDPNNETIRLTEVDKHINKTIKVLGRITSIKIIKTKYDSLMAFATLQSDYTIIEVTAFNKIYSNYQDQIQLNKVVLLQTKVDIYQEKVKLILEKVLKSL